MQLLRLEMEAFRPSFEGCPEAWRLFLEAYTAQMAGDLAAAVARYTQSIRLHPTAEAWTFLGWTHSFMNRLGEAIACCERAIAVDPAFGNPYNDIGSYLMAQGRGDEAVDWFRKAMEAARYEARHYPHCNLGILLYQQRRDAEALAEFDRAIALEPGYATALAYRRLVLARRN